MSHLVLAIRLTPAQVIWHQWLTQVGRVLCILRTLEKTGLLMCSWHPIGHCVSIFRICDDNRMTVSWRPAGNTFPLNIMFHFAGLWWCKNTLTCTKRRSNNSQSDQGRAGTSPTWQSVISGLGAIKIREIKLTWMIFAAQRLCVGPGKVQYH